MIAGGIEVIGGGVMVASSAVAGGAWMRRHRTVTPWLLEYDGTVWRATNRTGEPTMEVRIKVDDHDVRGIALDEAIDLADDEAITFSTEPGAVPTFGLAVGDHASQQPLRIIEVSWKYET